MIAFLKRKYRNLISDKKFSEILTGSFFALMARVVATGLTMVTSIIIARLYGAEAMGVLAMINSVVTLVTIFTVMGTGMSILRLIPEHTTKHSVTSAFLIYRKTQYLVVTISVVTGTLFFFGSEMMADNVFSKLYLTSFFALSAWFIVFKSLMDLNTQAVRGLRLIKTFAIMQVLPSVAMLVTLLIATFFFRNPGNPVYAQFSAWTITAVAGALIMDRSFKNRMRPEDPVLPMPIKDIASLSLPMLMTASMHFFIGQIGVIMLGMFRSESEVGYYSVAVKLATLTAFVLQAINSMAAPKFSELYHSDRIDELFHVARKSTKLIFWTTTPILLFLVFLGRPVLGLLFGNEFMLAYPAMVLLVIGQFVSSISGSTSFFMNMTGHQDILRNIVFAAAVITVILSLILIPKFGMIGAAFAAMISLSYWNIHILLYIKYKYGRSIGYVPYLR